MAINYSIEIQIDSGVSGDKIADLQARVLQALRAETLADVLATTYSAGSNSTNHVTITVGGGTAGYGIRIIMDSAVVGAQKLPTILAIIINTLRSEVITIAHSASYTVGSRTYNHVITIT